MTMDDASGEAICNGESSGPNADGHGLTVRNEPTPLGPIIRFGLLQRLIAAAGSVVALVTFTAGTWWLLQHSLHTPFGNRPPQFVLVFGAYGSAIVGVVYGPAWTALQRRGRLLCDEWYPLRNLAEIACILGRASDRQKLEQMLGLDRGIITDLQGGLVILVPLLASAVAAFLPH